MNRTTKSRSRLSRVYGPNIIEVLGPLKAKLIGYKLYSTVKTLSCVNKRGLIGQGSTTLC